MSKLKLEVGKTYRSREGELVEIIAKDNHPSYPFESKDNAFTKSGRSSIHRESPQDLIEEVSPNPQPCIKGPELDLRLAQRINEALEGSRGEAQQRIAEVGLDWIALLLRKNSDYGSSVWQEQVLCPGLDVSQAILVRMSDKIERLRSLSGKTPEVAESRDDTLRDLGAYCLLELAQPREEVRSDG